MVDELDSAATDELAEALYNDDPPDEDAVYNDVPNGDLRPEGFAGDHAGELVE
jgi:hypothetical protein